MINLPKTGIALLCLLLLGACKDKKQDDKENLGKKAFLPDENPVTVMVLQKGIFKKELLSNGKLVALQKSVLNFQVSEHLERLMVINGQQVRKGALLASLDDFTYKQDYKKSQMQAEKAKIDFEDQLLGRGYQSMDREKIPPKEYDLIMIRSGYKQALNDLAKAKANLQSTQLIAPFSGKVASVKVKPYDYVGAGKEVMTLIDDRFFEVSFQLIASEVMEVAVGMPVKVLPFALSESYDGQIVSINPLVEKGGTVLVKAKVKNDGKLLEGMNVKVFMEKEIPDKFVVPKSAVILRQNQEVLFKVQKGKTYWTYVKTIGENSKEYDVIPHPDKGSASLKVGDTIVVMGNLNLAHDIKVKVEKVVP